MISWPLYTFVFIELVFVTIADIKHKKISNLWSLLNIFLAITLFILFPKIYTFNFEALQYSLVFIVVGFFLFLLNIMGGGDSKYLASFFLIIPVSLQDLIFYYLLITTIVVGLLFFFRNVIQERQNIISSLLRQDVGGIKKSFGTKFAYAPVIMTTWILFGLTNAGLL